MEGLRTRIKFSLIFGSLFFLVFYGFVGWRTDHTVLLGLIIGFSLIHKYGFYIVLALAGFIGFVTLYDAMTFLPNYDVNEVHLKDLYDLEVRYFGIMDGGQKVSLCEWYHDRMSDFQSFIYGFAYLLWVPGPMIFTLYLLIKDKPGLVEFAYAYLLTNVIGIIVYNLYPAAPPWYYLTYGDVLNTSAFGSEAYLSEFDRLTGTQIFKSIYNKGANVFGAVPSLHAAYPLLGLLFAYRLRHKWFIVFFIFMAIGTWIGAVYSWHHYVIDVILGILCALLAFWLMLKIIPTTLFQNFKALYLRMLSL